MAYIVNYTIKSKESSQGGGDVGRRTFTAVFDFENEVAKVDRRAVEERLRIREESIEILDKSSLHSYLFSAEGLEYKQLAVNSFRNSQNYQNNKVAVRVYIPTKGFWNRKPQLKIEMKGSVYDYDVPLEALLDFDKINKFILTGKIDSAKVP